MSFEAEWIPSSLRVYVYDENKLQTWRGFIYFDTNIFLDLACGCFFQLTFDVSYLFAFS